MANDCIPLFRPGVDITAQASAAVTGKRVVKISGNITSGPGLSATAEGSNPRVAHCSGAADVPFGVSKYDAVINGKVGVIREGIVPVTAGAPITAGQQVMADANGQVIPYVYAGAAVPIPVGTAIADASSGADCYVALRLT